jgi:heme-degrading monooxygenase HmoA
MSSAVLYRWRLKPGRDEAFREAWAEGTRLIHETCGSYGATLHQDEDGLYWSYALWPSEDARKACFSAHDWFAQDCFITMQDCIDERFEEIRLTVTNAGLVPPPVP